jgi:zinc transport system substrate-binding protein
MNGRIRVALAAVSLILFGAGSVSWHTDARSAAADQTTDCTVSILPQAFLVQRIGGSRVTVHVMVGPGQVPHTYEPTGRQLAELSNSQLFFSVGVAFEKSLIPRIRRNFPSVKIVDSASGTTKRMMIEDAGFEKTAAGVPGEAAASGGTARDDHHGDYDPHVWLSPGLGAAIGRNIRDALSAIDPEGAPSYATNCRMLEAELDSVDSLIAGLLRPYAGREIFVFHPAYGYFTDAYGLVQVAIEENGGAPGPKHLAGVIERARRQGVKTVFVQPQVSATSAQTVAKAIGAEVVSLDPLAADYVDNLLFMAGKIAESFERKVE